MKASAELVKVLNLYDRIEELLAPINAKLSSIIGEDTHIVNQPGDGLCICYGDGENSAIAPREIDKLLLMKRGELLEWLLLNGV